VVSDLTITLAMCCFELVLDWRAMRVHDVAGSPSWSAGGCQADVS
jgi:hypothetical protein